MPTNEPWQQQHSLKKRWKGWAAPLPSGAWLATDTLAAADASAAANKGGSDIGTSRSPLAERMDVNFNQQLPQVTLCHRGTIWEQTQLPNPTRQKCWVTFAEPMWCSALGTLVEYTFISNLKNVWKVYQQLLAKQVLNKGRASVKAINPLGKT